MKKAGLRCPECKRPAIPAWDTEMLSMNCMRGACGYHGPPERYTMEEEEETQPSDDPWHGKYSVALTDRIGRENIPGCSE